MVMPTKHPNEKTAERIRVMAAIGITHKEMAAILKISLDTMHNKYRDDLDYGKAAIHELCGGKIVEAIRKGEQWACTLWAARRMGWKETADHNVTVTNVSKEQRDAAVRAASVADS